MRPVHHVSTGIAVLRTNLFFEILLARKSTGDLVGLVESFLFVEVKTFHRKQQPRSASQYNESEMKRAPIATIKQYVVIEAYGGQPQ